MVVDIGRICVKTAGRDAAQYCVVVEVHDNNYVTVDGNTRRKKVNLSHLEPTTQTIDIKAGASTKDVLEAFAKADIEVKKSAEKKEKKEKKPQVKKAKKGSNKSEEKKTSKKE